MEQSQPLAKLDGAAVSRSGRWLVRSVSLTLMPGEIMTLIGPNGAGKSTTAKLVLGVLKPDEGSTWRRPGLRIGYVPQRLAIDWTLPLSVRRFMDLTGRIDDETARRALGETEVGHLARAEMQTLSGGEFQRVLLARAIARQPELMVLDEPVQGVDYAGEAALYDLIRRIRDRHGCGILLISHNLHLVMAATDRVVCLNGHVCCSGTPGTVAASPEYRTLFGARASAGLAVYEHHHDHTHLPDGRVKLADGTVSDATAADGCHPAHGPASSNPKAQSDA